MEFEDHYVTWSLKHTMGHWLWCAAHLIEVFGFRNVSICSYLEFRTMEKVQGPSNSGDLLIKITCHFLYISPLTTYVRVASSGLSSTFLYVLCTLVHLTWSVIGLGRVISISKVPVIFAISITFAERVVLESYADGISVQVSAILIGGSSIFLSHSRHRYRNFTCN
jgi:hypothetical protein